VWGTVRYANQSYNWVEEEEEWISVSAIAEAVSWKKEVREALMEALRVLPERLRQVIKLSYGLGKEPARSLASIGREWGISRERVRQLRNDGLVLLRIPAVSIQIRVLYDKESYRSYKMAERLNRGRLGGRKER